MAARKKPVSANGKVHTKLATGSCIMLPESETVSFFEHPPDVPLLTTRKQGFEKRLQIFLNDSGLEF